MKTCLTALVCIWPVYLLAQDRVLREPAPGIAVVPVESTFLLEVRDKPLFPGAERPEASTPAEERGLSVTIQPEKKSFAVTGPLAFEVVFKNESDKPFRLHGLELLGGKARLVISNQQTAAQWTLSGPEAKDGVPAATELAAGASKTLTVVVRSNVVQPRPRPVPFPQPVPLDKDAAEPGKAPFLRIAPVPGGPPLPCGAGQCRAFLLMDFPASKAPAGQTPEWVGKIATKPADFTVAGVEAVPVPVPRPVVPQPRRLPAL